MAAKEERLKYTLEQEINFMYLIIVGELTHKQVHERFDIGLTSLTTRITKIKTTLTTVSYIADTVLYSDLPTIEKSLVVRLVTDSLTTNRQKKTQKKLSTMTTSILPASISESTPFGKLPPINLALRNTLDISGVA